MPEERFRAYVRPKSKTFPWKIILKVGSNDERDCFARVEVPQIGKNNLIRNTANIELKS